MERNCSYWMVMTPSMSVSCWRNADVSVCRAEERRVSVTGGAKLESRARSGPPGFRHRTEMLPGCSIESNDLRHRSFLSCYSGYVSKLNIQRQSLWRYQFNRPLLT